MDMHCELMRDVQTFLYADLLVIILVCQEYVVETNPHAGINEWMSELMNG